MSPPPPDPERLARLALWSIRGLSARTIDAAVAAYGSALDACRAPRDDLATALDLGAGTRGRLLASPEDLVSLGAALEAQVAARGGAFVLRGAAARADRKSTRLNSSHTMTSRMPSSA